MIEKELEKRVWEENNKNSSREYTQNILKEYLQAYLLYFVYTSPLYKSLIFTGGTCLRHFYGLERLSVDLDFDYEIKPNAREMLDEIYSFFHQRYKYTLLSGSIKQKGSQILLKFPVLHALGLAEKHESDLLYVKVDLSGNPSSSYNDVKTSKNIYGLNFVARHYDLPDLMAGKLHAVLTRRYLRGKDDRHGIKGRDYFDLLWFVKKGVRPNLQRLSNMLSEKLSMAELEKRCDEKVGQFVSRHKGDFRSDILPLVAHPDAIKDSIDNYEDEYRRWKGHSFSTTIRLEVKCLKCQKAFPSGISVTEETLETMNLSGNVHKCPHCGYLNKMDQKGYIFIVP